jgi:antitoxin ParD1/3/4
METVSITLPDSIKQYVEEQVARGGYGSVSDYLRHLVETDQKEQVRAALESEVLKGLESGESTPMTSEDWRAIREETEVRHAARQQRDSGSRGLGQR